MYEEESRLTASVGACEESLPCEFVSAHVGSRDPCRRPQQEFREMFFDIWAARPGTKLRKNWAQRGVDRRSDPRCQEQKTLFLLFG